MFLIWTLALWLSVKKREDNIVYFLAENTAYEILSNSKWKGNLISTGTNEML